MKTKMLYEDALAFAQDFIEQIRPLCERVEIAGSLRREKPQVGDIEVVCISRMTTVNDLFGTPVIITAIDEIGAMFKLLRNGPNYKQLDFGTFHLDLFITTPAQWGVIYTIRTGSADFSHWLVTPRSKGGGCPSYLKIQDGRVTDGKHYFPTPEEKDVFSGIRFLWCVEGHSSW